MTYDIDIRRIIEWSSKKEKIKRLSDMNKIRSNLRVFKLSIKL